MKKILVVEDVEFNRDLIVQLLEDDYQVLTAVDGDEGLRRAAQDRPDLIRTVRAAGYGLETEAAA